MKVVLDTNVIISAVFWGGPPRRVLEACVDGRLSLMCSMEILDEYVRVLSDPVFGAKPTETTYWTELLLQLADFVVPATIEQVIPDDPADKMFLACALASKTRLVTSGDKALLATSGFRGVTVLTPRQFVDRHLT